MFGKNKRMMQRIYTVVKERAHKGILHVTPKHVKYTKELLLHTHVCITENHYIRLFQQLK